MNKEDHLTLENELGHLSGIKDKQNQINQLLGSHFTLGNTSESMLKMMMEFYKMDYLDDFNYSRAYKFEKETNIPGVEELYASLGQRKISNEQSYKIQQAYHLYNHLAERKKTEDSQYSFFTPKSIEGHYFDVTTRSKLKKKRQQMRELKKRNKQLEQVEEGPISSVEAAEQEDNEDEKQEIPRLKDQSQSIIRSKLNSRQFGMSEPNKQDGDIINDKQMRKHGEEVFKERDLNVKVRSQKLYQDEIEPIKMLQAQSQMKENNENKVEASYFDLNKQIDKIILKKMKLVRSQLRDPNKKNTDEDKASKMQALIQQTSNKGASLKSATKVYNSKTSKFRGLFKTDPKKSHKSTPHSKTISQFQKNKQISTSKIGQKQHQQMEEKEWDEHKKGTDMFEIKSRVLHIKPEDKVRIKIEQERRERELLRNKLIEKPENQKFQQHIKERREYIQSATAIGYEPKTHISNLGIHTSQQIKKGKTNIHGVIKSQTEKKRLSKSDKSNREWEQENQQKFKNQRRSHFSKAQRKKNLSLKANGVKRVIKKNCKELTEQILDDLLQEVIEIYNQIERNEKSKQQRIQNGAILSRCFEAVKELNMYQNLVSNNISFIDKDFRVNEQMFEKIQSHHQEEEKIKSSIPTILEKSKQHLIISRKISLETKFVDEIKSEALTYQLVKKGDKILSEKSNIKMNHAVEDFIDDLIGNLSKQFNELETEYIQAVFEEEFNF